MQEYRHLGNSQFLSVIWFIQKRFKSALHSIWNKLPRRLFSSHVLAENTGTDILLPIPEPPPLPPLPPVFESPLPNLAIFSGGSAFNCPVSELSQVYNHISFVMPVSDNGGSTAEIIRVIRGPAIGDIRSRLLKLAADDSEQSQAVKRLLEYRLPSGEHDIQARYEWTSIVEGSHPMWRGVGAACKASVRAFLVEFSHELQTRADKHFDYRAGSIGNFFFSGARIFFHSLEAAIFWFKGIAGIPKNWHVVPVLNTNKRINICAQLADGSTILGQQNISHPLGIPDVDSVAAMSGLARNVAVKGPNFEVNKDHDLAFKLHSPIRKIYYANEDYQPIRPRANLNAIEKIENAQHIVYSHGSLYTSIIPCLIIPGIGESIARKAGRKVLVLNGWTDRETDGMTAVDFVYAVCRALTRYSDFESRINVTSYVNTVVVPKGGNIPCDLDLLSNLGIKVVECLTLPDEKNRLAYDIGELTKILKSLPALI